MRPLLSAYTHGGAERVNVERCYPEDDKPGKLGPVTQDHIIHPPEQLSTAVSHKSPPPIQHASSYDHVSPNNKLFAPHLEGLRIQDQSLKAGHQPETHRSWTGSVRIPGRAGAMGPQSESMEQSAGRELKSVYNQPGWERG